MRTQVARTRLADEVYVQLREAILQGELPAGTRLRVQALAEEFDVSRSPVREAVQRLVRVGLVEEQPHRGAVVASILPGGLVALYQVREVLEGLAARLAAHRADDDTFAALRQALDDHEDALDDGSPHAHMDADLRFHRLTREAAANPELSAQMERLQGMVRMAMLRTSLSEGGGQALEDHRLILDAMLARDPDEAERLARAHVARLTRALEHRAYTDVPEPQEVETDPARTGMQ